MGPEETTLVDANLLLGRHPRTRTGTVTTDALLKWMDRVGVTSALVGHTASWLHDPPTGNRRLIEQIADIPRLRPAWVVVPGHSGESPPPRRIAAEAREHGVAALRAYPADHGWSLTGRDAAPYWRVLADAGLPLLVDAGQTNWTQIEECATAHPGLRLLVCDTGYRALRAISGVLARTGNVSVDISYLSTHQGLEWLVERFGATRLVFGTGAPARDPAEAVARLMWSDLDGAAVAAIGADNLRQLLGEGARDT